jgi:hypothetical protein
VKVIATIASLLLLVCPMARRAIFPEVTDAVTGVVAALRSTYICDVEAVDKPTSGVQPGDFCLCLDTGKYYKCLSTNVWSDVAGAAAIPSGLISLWHGLLSAIPSGWALCDGQNGTPDLRDRFVKGAAAGQNPGTTGGSPTHTHADHPALAHSGAAVADHASHTHQYTDIVNHTHPVTDPGHNHTQNSHNHIQDSHNHTQNSFAPRIVNSGTAGTVGVQGASTASNANASNSPTTATNQAATATNQAATATNNQNTTGVTTTAPVGGVAAGTTQGPGAPLTHAVTQPSDHAAQGHQDANGEPSYYTVAYIMKA